MAEPLPLRSLQRSRSPHSRMLAMRRAPRRRVLPQSRRVVERRRDCNLCVRCEGARKLSGTLHRGGRNTYTVNATCATASGRATQTATVRQVGDNRYSGSFYNSEYSISGVIHIVVRGASQSVRLISDSASATINLSR